MLRAAEHYRNVMIENIEMTHSLHYRATHDGLVGLLNRDEFKNIFNSTATNTHKITTSIIFIDLDNFKTLNDTFGHQAGDDALIKISDIIRSAAIRHS
jgi:diguanylate cyclase (GGDEF)-like protein